jgi:hypothetical protein
MKAVTPTQLRADIYNMLDEVLETGIPLVIRKGKRRLLIVPAEEPDKLRNLVRRPEIILSTRMNCRPSVGSMR